MVALIENRNIRGGATLADYKMLYHKSLGLRYTNECGSVDIGSDIHKDIPESLHGTVPLNSALVGMRIA